MVSACSPISHSSSLFTKPLGMFPSTPISISINVTFPFHSFLSSLAGSKCLSPFSFSLIFTLWSARRVKYIIWQVLFFFVNYYFIWHSGRDLVISLDLKNPENFVRLTLQDGFKFMHIPPGYMVKFQFRFISPWITVITSSCLIIIMLLLASFSQQLALVVFFYRSQGDCKFPQVSSTLLSILVDLNHVLCFDLLTRPKMPFKVMHRKEVTHSNGSYERKSRWRKLADEMGRGKKKIP